MMRIIVPLTLLLFATLPCARAQTDAAQAERCVRRYAAHYRCAAGIDRRIDRC